MKGRRLMQVAGSVNRTVSVAGTNLEPKHVREINGLQGDLEIEALPGQVILPPSAHPRAGWAEAFAAMADTGDDVLLDAQAEATALSHSGFDRDVWRWDRSSETGVQAPGATGYRGPIEHSE